MRDRKEKVRVRFAPSPTGYLHLGGARTALFNWLFARHNKGVFILRIEDTDRARSTEDAINAIVADLTWLGLGWDEGPYRQMDRLALYHQAANRLLAKGKAYFCYCLPEELEARRQEALQKGITPQYDRRCYRITDEERKGFLKQGRQPVIRFFSPDEGETIFEDLIRGRVAFKNASLDDLIIMRPDGIPTYNFASVVDDFHMKITHVIRGEDHLSNTPRQILLYQALELTPPSFAHLSMILGKDRAPLSKRHGATAVSDYHEQGFLPEAVVNCLALLGWAYDEKTTLFSRQELVEKFSLEKVTKSPAIFDLAKLSWMNGYYLRGLSLKDLTKRLIPFWQKAGFLEETIDEATFEWLKGIAEICQERIDTLQEVIALTDFFFKEVEYDPVAVEKVLKKPEVKVILDEAEKILSTEDFSTEKIEKNFRELAEKLGLKSGKVFQPIRVAVTGRTVSPPLFETLALLGKERSLVRIKRAKELMRI